MNKQSLFFTFLTAIISTVLILMIIKFIAKRWNLKSHNEEKINLSYVIWLLSILIPFFALLKVALNKVENTIEIIIFSKTIENTFLESLQKIALFIGFTFIGSFLSYYIVSSILKLTYGDVKDSHEIENNNVGFFIIKLAITTLLVFSLLDVFEHFLSWFSPIVETPFYR
jgi:uncharacterized BrkB/YihY/UPF0761 family membrane protein